MRIKFALPLLLLLLSNSTASAFCGFYVARAKGDLFNEASKVVMARKDNRTVLTMVNDYEGDAREFAMVIPTPTVLQREQIHVTENRIIDHLDDYTAPRLVEYHDDDPCLVRGYNKSIMMRREAPPPMMESTQSVTIEAQYTVGEYDILILSAKESDGLESWLIENGYKIPEGAKDVLGSYIRQGMKFFVAKVNITEQAKLGVTTLRPLQIAFESEKFMLPIRLGTVNAKGKQDLLLFTLTEKGRVETVNYRVIRIPSDEEIPLYVQNEFGTFYKTLFDKAVEREGGSAVMLEYAWNMGWCDPCAADPLANKDLQELGVFWLPPNQQITLDTQGNRRIARPPSPRAQNVFVTRLHVRYDAETFPEDLRLMETSDGSNFQGRYIIRHPFKGDASCDAGREYQNTLETRYYETSKKLAQLTGWDIEDIRNKMSRPAGLNTTPESQKPWWEKIWE